MPRTVGDLTRPLGRTVTPAEAAAIRRYILRQLRAVMLKALGGYLTLAALFAGAFALDWLTGGSTSQLRGMLGVQGVLAGGFVLLLAMQCRRLRSLRELTTLAVHRVESPMEGRFARLFSPATHRRHRLFADNAALHPVHPRPGFPSDEVVWQLDVVRTHRGGPEQFFVLDARPVRPATPADRAGLHAYLWQIGVHRHTD